MNNRNLPGQYDLDLDRARVTHFESIWDNTQGSDFEKIFAMLEDYAGFMSWGTYKNEVREVLNGYSSQNGYLNTVKNKQALVFSMEFLLLQLSEKISFNSIKRTGDMNALFDVIFSRTKRTPFRYDRAGNIYSLYVKYIDKIKNGIVNVDQWKDMVLLLMPNLDAGEIKHLVGEFYHSGFIEYVDKCNLLLDCKECSAWDWTCELSDGLKSCDVSDEELTRWFKLSIEKRHYEFAWHLFNKKYDLNGVQREFVEYMGKESNHIITLIGELSNSINKDVDNHFLLIANRCLIERMQKENILEVAGDGSVKVKSQCFSSRHANNAIMGLICKNELIAQGDVVIDQLIGWFSPRFDIILCNAITDKSFETVSCLLKDKKFTINLQCLFYINGNEIAITPLQYAIWHACRKPDSGTLTFLCDTVRLLVSYDPDCVRIKDKKGNDICWYLSELRNKRGTTEIAVQIINEIHSVIQKPFLASSMTFFFGFFDRNSFISMLDKDVVKRLAMESSDMFSEHRSRKM